MFVFVFLILKGKIINLKFLCGCLGWLQIGLGGWALDQPWQCQVVGCGGRCGSWWAWRPWGCGGRGVVGSC